MDSLRQLRVSTQLTQTIQDLHDETTMRLHNALQVSCTDFRPEPYSKVFQHPHGATLPMHSAYFSKVQLYLLILHIVSLRKLTFV